MTKYEFSDTHCSVNLTLLKGVRGVLPILSTYFIFGGGEGRSRCGRCSRKFIDFWLLRENRLSEINAYVGA